MSAAAEPVRRDAAYWARVRRIVDMAPPLSDEQRVRIRGAIHQSGRGAQRAPRTDAA